MKIMITEEEDGIDWERVRMDSIESDFDGDEEESE
jgi:hypothetical protein